MVLVQGQIDAAGRSGRRQGTVLTVLFMVAFPVLVAIMVMAINAALLAEARADLQNAADASALAAAGALVDDAWLIGDAARQQAIVNGARAQAQAYAGLNKTLGQPLVLQSPPTTASNPADGDVVFAFLDKARSPDPRERTLVVADLDSSYNGGPFVTHVNTVRVNARRLKARGSAIALLGAGYTGIGFADAEMRATATLDRDVIGFRPVADQAIPLAPIALLTRGASGTPSSWEIELNKGIDVWRYDSASGSFMGGSDALPEATLDVKFDESQASAVLLLIGVSDVATLGGQAAFDGQLAMGMTAADLQGMGGAFVLGVNNRLGVAATGGNTSFYPALANQLNLIQGQKRIWPLYEVYDGPNGQAIVAGFVAARVVRAIATSDGVTLTLQPCMLATRAALTDSSRRGVGGIPITNPYIAKIRLVD